MTSRYRISTAYDADAPGIAELIRSTSLTCCFSLEQPCPDWYEATVTTDQIRRLLQSEEMICLVATEENRVVGVLAVHENGHVKYFFVHPDHQQRGIGKSLWAVALQTSTLGPTLTVRSSLFAVPVYERLGFTTLEPPQVFRGMHYQAMLAQRTDIHRSIAGQLSERNPKQAP